MSISIKTVFDGNIHRFFLVKPSYDELEQALNSIYGKRGFSVRYQDEDGDMISVSSTLELQEALRVAKGNTLKLILSQPVSGNSFGSNFEKPKESVVQSSEKLVKPMEESNQSLPQSTERKEPPVVVRVATDCQPTNEEKAQPPPRCDEMRCDEMRALACQFLSDPAVQLILPDLTKAVLAKIVVEARNKENGQGGAARVLELITSNTVIQNHPAMGTLAPHLGKLRDLLACVIERIPLSFLDVLDKLKDGFQPNVEMLMKMLANPMASLSSGLDCGTFDVGSMGLSLSTLLPLLGKFSCGPIDCGFECKSPSKPPTKNTIHENVRCDGCNVFPITGARYNCTVCNDFDLCAKCEASGVHPPEHALLKYRQPANTQVVHHGVTCDGCQKSPITGIRFKCRVCADFDLCEDCEAKNTHPIDHPLIKFKVEKMRPSHGSRRPFHLLHEALRGHRCRSWLARGSVGDGVKEIQQMLGLAPDGVFGPKTEQAVKDFQVAQGLDVDGIVGPRTRAKLQAQMQQPLPYPPGEVSSPVKVTEKQLQTPVKEVAAEKKESISERKESEGGLSWLSRGSVGDSVREIQGALGIPVDGFFGPRTEQAVKDFQTAHCLAVDGVVGPQTRSTIFGLPSLPATSALEQLTNMGFLDVALNTRFLQKHKGDIDQVIAELLER